MSEEFTTSLNTLGLIITALSFAFLIGYNWRRVNVVERTIEDMVKMREAERETLDDLYVRKDIATLQLDHVRRQIDYLTNLERVREISRENRESQGLPTRRKEDR